MPREASDATKLAAARREIRELEGIEKNLAADRNAWRKRAEVAEAAVTEWKQRFDKLLDRTPGAQGGSQ